MKKILLMVTAIIVALFAGQSVFAANAGAQAGIMNVTDVETPMPTLYTSPNPISGDGIKNKTQDEEYGDYGDQVKPESPNELSGDGIQNATQDEDFGEYGKEESPNELSGDGILNSSQDEEYGHYGEQEEGDEMKEEGNVGEDMKQARERYEIKNADDIEGVLMQERERIESEINTDEDEDKAEVKRNQKDMRVAIGVMAAGSDLFGSSSPRIRTLSREIDDATEDVLQAEIELRDRGAFARFFLGGNDEVAENLQKVVLENKERLLEMNQIMEACTDCDGEVKTKLLEQIQIMEQEQVRIEEEAEEEMEKEGVFGFLFGWMK